AGPTPATHPLRTLGGDRHPRSGGHPEAYRRRRDAVLRATWPPWGRRARLPGAWGRGGGRRGARRGRGDGGGGGNGGRSLLHRRGFARLRVHGRLGDDGRGCVQEVPDRESANPAPLIDESPAMLVGPGPPQHLHPDRTALVGGRGRDDPFWIEIL